MVGIIYIYIYILYIYIIYIYAITYNVTYIELKFLWTYHSVIFENI